MANIDKKSVRSEVDKVKIEFERLCDAGKVSSEINVLMSSMLMIMELILSIFLERQTRKNSNNSSLPPSQTDKDDTSLPPKGSHKKGKSENSTIADNVRVTKTVTLSKVHSCEVCGEDLQHAPVQGYERRTKIDIIFEKVVDHIDAEIKQCPTCDAMTKGSFPADRHGPLQYGSGIKAFIINLMVVQMVSISRVQKLVKSMMGTVIAEATLLRFVLRLHQALEEWEQVSIQKMLSLPAINVDETSLRVDKKNHWIHVYSSGDLTLKFLHRKRGLEAIEHINIIPRYGGVIIHDCWASYLSYKHCGHGLCGSHLLRELTFIVESNGYPWARNIKRLLQETCKKVAESKDKKLDDRAYANLQKRYRNIMTRGEKQLPIIPPKPSGKRGKLAKSDAHNLWQRLKDYETAVLMFAKDSNVSFTNNRAEQDLRMAKVKLKVSGCFRTQVYAHAYCRISSYLQTMANKGYNPLVAIQMALAGKAL
ncbi:MAG: IS66 family transposase [Kangiellaceae bacterium]|nr:IS66 family transposase [Kangiellaceae bacterium]